MFIASKYFNDFGSELTKKTYPFVYPLTVAPLS